MSLRTSPPAGLDNIDKADYAQELVVDALAIIKVAQKSCGDSACSSELIRALGVAESLLDKAWDQMGQVKSDLDAGVTKRRTEEVRA